MDALTLLTELRPGVVVRIYSSNRRLRVWAHAECVLANELAHAKHCMQMGYKVRAVPGRIPYTERCVLCNGHSPHPEQANSFLKSF